MPYDTPFGGVLQGLLASQQIQRQQAQEMADQVFRQKQLDFSVKQFDAEQEQDKITNQRADKKLDDDFWLNLMDMAEKQYQFDTQQERFNADRKSREAVAKIKADSAKEIADTKNLTAEERYILGEAMKNADTPEAAAGLQEWIRGRLRRSAGETTPAMPSGAPAPPPTAAPGPPQMSLNPPVGSDLWNVLQGTPLAPTASPPAGQAGFDPSKPFGGAAGAQTRSRNAYADIAEQKAAHLKDQFALNALKANAGIEHQKAVTAKLKVMTPIERDLLLQRIAESKERIRLRGQEIALKERNTQWEHTYKNSALALRKQMVGGALDGIIKRQSEAGMKMVAVGKQRDALLKESERLQNDRDNNQPSLLNGSVFGGSDRDQRILELDAQADDLSSIYEGAKLNHQHYRILLEETGNLRIQNKPPPEGGEGEKPPATVPPSKRGAKGLAKVTLSNGIQMPDTRGMSVGQMLDSQVRAMQSKRRSPGTKAAPQKAATPARKQETDAEIMARLRKKY